jgi:adenosylcobinamide-phosphate synthase
MSFFAVFFALLLEQLKPLPRGNVVHDALTHWMRWIGRNFDAGKQRHAVLVWLITVALPAFLACLIYWAAAEIQLLLALGWNVLVLYLTLGFRQFSHFFTDIRAALERGDERQARDLLTQWRHLDASELPRTELLRHVIEHALLAAHRHVFGVFFCFAVFSALGLGPAGAVLYRLAEFANRYWAFKSATVGEAVNERLMQLSQAWFGVLDHIPARLTAFGFAAVGNFEEAVDCWRRFAKLWKRPNEGIILAAAAGAVGVQLGGPAAPGVTPDRSKSFDHGDSVEVMQADGSTPGSAPALGHLGSVVGLVWRSVVLWMALLALLSLANRAG